MKNMDVNNIKAAKDLLLAVGTMIPCEGFEKVAGIDTIQTKTEHKVYASKFQRVKYGVLSQNETRCLQCKYLRRLLLNHASYKRTGAKETYVVTSSELIRKNARSRRQTLKHNQAEGQRREDKT